MAITLHPSFRGSYMDVNSIPYLEKELIILGKSNVGKSTLINSLLGTKICHTSKMPGRTTAINVITIDKARLKAIVDLPGYGFAKSPEKVRKQWSVLLPEYLAMKRNYQRRCWVLVPVYSLDGAVDSEIINLLVNYGVEIRIIITKIDKLKATEQQKKYKEVKELYALYQGISIYTFSKYGSAEDLIPLKKDMNGYFSN